MAEIDRLIPVRRPPGISMRDDPHVQSLKDAFLIPHQYLKQLYAEMSDRLKSRPRDRTKANRALFSAMGEALRRDAGRMGGSPRSSAERCPCGEMTKARAKARYHYCDSNGPLPSRRDLNRIKRSKVWRD